MDAAQVATTVAAVAGVHWFMGQRPLHERTLDSQADVEIVDRDRRYKPAKSHQNLRRDDVVGVEPMPNNSAIGSPRYHVHLKNGAVLEMFGPVVQDFIDPQH